MPFRFLSQDPTHNAFVDFLFHYGYIIAIAVAVVITILVIVLLFLQKKNKNLIENKHSINSNAFFDSLGGRHNILSYQRSGSRIFLTLLDYSKINDNQLKDLGVDSIIKMSNKIILVSKNGSEFLYKFFD